MTPLPTHIRVDVEVAEHAEPSSSTCRAGTPSSRGSARAARSACIRGVRACSATGRRRARRRRSSRRPPGDDTQLTLESPARPGARAALAEQDGPHDPDRGVAREEIRQRSCGHRPGSAAAASAAAHPELTRSTTSTVHVCARTRRSTARSASSPVGAPATSRCTGGSWARGCWTPPAPARCSRRRCPTRCEATKAVDGGAGVLYIVKNYTGDVLNFEMAAELAGGRGTASRWRRSSPRTTSPSRTARTPPGRRGVGGTLLRGEDRCGCGRRKEAALPRRLSPRSPAGQSSEELQHGRRPDLRDRAGRRAPHLRAVGGPRWRWASASTVSPAGRAGARWHPRARSLRALASSGLVARGTSDFHRRCGVLGVRQRHGRQQ